MYLLGGNRGLRPGATSGSTGTWRTRSGTIRRRRQLARPRRRIIFWLERWGGVTVVFCRNNRIHLRPGHSIWRSSSIDRRIDICRHGPRRWRIRVRDRGTICHACVRTGGRSDGARSRGRATRHRQRLVRGIAVWLLGVLGRWLSIAVLRVLAIRVVDGRQAHVRSGLVWHLHLRKIWWCIGWSHRVIHSLRVRHRVLWLVLCMPKGPMVRRRSHRIRLARHPRARRCIGRRLLPFPSVPSRIATSRVTHRRRGQLHAL